jgi:hypothetical protein
VSAKETKAAPKDPEKEIPTAPGNEKPNEPLGNLKDVLAAIDRVGESFSAALHSLRSMVVDHYEKITKRVDELAETQKSHGTAIGEIRKSFGDSIVDHEERLRRLERAAGIGGP